MNKRLSSLVAMGCLALAASATSFAAELFPNGKPYEFSPPAEVLSNASTAGGYAIYQGDEQWLLTHLSVRAVNTPGDAFTINMGTVQLDQVTAKGWSARMYTTVNLNVGNPNLYMTGDPCAGSHLIAINKGLRKDDNCLIVDATGGDGGTLLVLRSIQSKSSGRLYQIALFMNLETLPGLEGTKVSDWTPAAVAAVPKRAAFVQRLKAWGALLQDASEQALDVKKPLDAYAGIPSYRTLAEAQVESQ